MQEFTVLCVSVALMQILSSCSGSPINATYDQRQNGKVNVHISIKDVAIILQGDSGLNGNGEDDVNYDYDYDYDHLTVKPNGIWATLGQSTLAPSPLLPVTSSPTPAVNPPSAAVNSESSSNSTATADDEESGNEETDQAPMLTLIQYPVSADYKPPQQLETLSDLSHPFPEAAAPSSSSLPTSESPIIQITSKPGNRTTNKYAWNGDLEEIPVEVIIEPVLKNKQRQHVVPGSRSRPTRKFARNNSGKHTNKFGVQQLIKLLSVLDKDDDKDYAPKAE